VYKFNIGINSMPSTRRRDMTRTFSSDFVSGSVPAIGRHVTSGQPTTLFARLSTLLSVWEERRTLASLDERTLADLGLSKADVEREATRSMFDIPCNRI
jgi:uncharacterized protein YjiS (DUF1127 family)